MAKLFSWDPWIELESMQEDLLRLVEDVVSLSPFSHTSSSALRFRPVADVLEQKDQFIILLELPGVDREDIVIEIYDQKLVIHGERRFTVAESVTSFHTLEGAYGQFERQFALPARIDTSTIKAKLTAGVLMVFISKEPATPTHTVIAINMDK